MKSKSLLFYVFILSIGSFLYLPVMFSYGLFAPLHVLIIWLMHDRFLSGLKSDLTISKTTYATIPCVVQNVLFSIFLLSSEDWNFATLIELYFSIIGLILILVTIVEFFILKGMYAKYLLKHDLQ